MAKQLQVFICGRGVNNPGKKYKCIECEKYFKSSEEWKNHECEKKKENLRKNKE